MRSSATSTETPIGWANGTSRAPRGVSTTRRGRPPTSASSFTTPSGSPARSRASHPSTSQWKTKPSGLAATSSRETDTYKFRSDSAASEPAIPTTLTRPRSPCGRTVAIRASRVAPSGPAKRTASPSRNRSGKSVRISTETSPRSPCGLTTRPMTMRSSGAFPIELFRLFRRSGLLGDQALDRVRRARALRDPSLCLVAVEIEERRVLRRVVVAELLDYLRGGRAAPVGDDDAVGRSVGAADAAQTDLEHDDSFRFPKTTRSAAHPRGTLHHLLHRQILLEELVHLGHRRARALRDPFLAAAVEELRVLALFRGHRVDHGLEALPRVLGNIETRGPLKGPDFRQVSEKPAQRAHLLELRHLLAEIGQRERVLPQLLGGTESGGLVGLGPHPLDERHYVAEPQEPRGRTIGVKQLQLFHLLARAHELQRLADDRRDRKRGAPPGVSIRLREDDAGQRQLRAEGPRRAHRILAGHRVGPH